MFEAHGCAELPTGPPRASTAGEPQCREHCGRALRRNAFAYFWRNKSRSPGRGSRGTRDELPFRRRRTPRGAGRSAREKSVPRRGRLRATARSEPTATRRKSAQKWYGLCTVQRALRFSAHPTAQIQERAFLRAGVGLRQRLGSSGRRRGSAGASSRASRFAHGAAGGRAARRRGRCLHMRGRGAENLRGRALREPRAGTCAVAVTGDRAGGARKNGAARQGGTDYMPRARHQPYCSWRLADYPERAGCALRASGAEIVCRGRSAPHPGQLRLRRGIGF